MRVRTRCGQQESNDLCGATAAGARPSDVRYTTLDRTVIDL